MKRILTMLMALALLPVVGWAQKEDYQKSYFYMRALEAYNAEDYEKAYDWFLKEVGEHPRNGYAHYFLGQFSEGMNNAEALKEYAKVIEYVNVKENKEFPVYAYCQMANIYNQMGDKAERDKAIKNALALAPTSLYALQALARHQSGDGDLEAVNKTNERMIAVAPHVGRTHALSAFTLSLMAKVAKKDGDDKRSAELMEKAIESIGVARALSNSPEANRVYVQLCTAAGRYGGAASTILYLIGENEFEGLFPLITELDSKAHRVWVLTLDQAIQEEPNNAILHTMRAFSHRDYGDFVDALADFRAYDEMTSEGGSWESISQCYLGLGMPKETVEYADLYVSATIGSDDEASARSKRSRLLLEASGMPSANSAGLIKRAEIDADSVVMLLPDVADAYISRARLRFSIGKVQEALADCEMAEQLNSDNSEAYLFHAGVLFSTGAKEVGRQMAEDALSVCSDDNHSALSSALGLLGRKDEAMPHVAEVLESARSNTDFYNLACVYSLVGEVGKAAEALRKCFDNGWSNFVLAKHDPDLANLWAAEDYDAFISRHRDAQRAMRERLASANKDAQLVSGEMTEVPYTPESGVCMVKCSINGLPLRFVFDTGASDVTISAVEANFMLKNGYLSEKDISGSKLYQTADGSISAGTTIVLRKVCFGGMTLTDVHASVVDSQVAPLLLGQSVFQKLGNIEIDNQAKVIRFRK